MTNFTSVKHPKRIASRELFLSNMRGYNNEQRAVVYDALNLATEGFTAVLNQPRASFNPDVMEMIHALRDDLFALRHSLAQQAEKDSPDDRTEDYWRCYILLRLWGDEPHENAEKIRALLAPHAPGDAFTSQPQIAA